MFADKRDDFAPNPFGKPPTCDAENLRQKGQELYSFGRVGEALGMFEAALKCAPGDVTLLRYTLASACKAKRLDKARLYWNKMNAAAQNPLESLCAANGLMRADLEGQPTARGRLRITNARAAKVFLDGRLIGTTGTGTPIDRQVAPGKHKIMFAIGDDKYTFSVLVKVGETLVVDKKLE